MNLENANIVVGGAIQMISGYLSAILGSIALVVAIQNVKQGQHSSIASVYREAIKLFLPVLVILAIKLPIVTGGSFLLFVPGILFYIWYFFWLYAAVIHKKRKAEALALSKAVVRTSMGRVIGCIIGYMLFGIAGYGLLRLLYYLEEGFLPYLLATIIYGGICSILIVWVKAFLFMFYIDLIKANPKILECFELGRIEYEKTE